MARCVYCGSETLLHISDVPVCTQCVDLSPDERAARGRLLADLGAAAEPADSAKEAFAAITVPDDLTENK